MCVVRACPTCSGIPCFAYRLEPDLAYGCVVCWLCFFARGDVPGPANQLMSRNVVAEPACVLGTVVLGGICTFRLYARGIIPGLAGQLISRDVVAKSACVLGWVI